MSKVDTTFEVTEKDEKLRRLVASLGIGNVSVDVGLVEGKSPGQIAEYAFYNEFGTRNIPERSFLRSTFDRKRGDYERFLIKLYDKVLASNGGVDIKAGLHTLGVSAMGDVKRKIQKLRTPPNAESTIRAKKSSNPLIDTTAMWNAVTYEVKDK